MHVKPLMSMSTLLSLLALLSWPMHSSCLSYLCLPTHSCFCFHRSFDWAAFIVALTGLHFALWDTACTTPCCSRYLRNITIPAAFVTKSTGDALKELVAKKPTGQEEVIAVMDWTDALPKADKVEWEFWTNSNDQCGAVCDVQKEFIKVLSQASLAPMLLLLLSS